MNLKYHLTLGEVQIQLKRNNFLFLHKTQQNTEFEGSDFFKITS